MITTTCTCDKCGVIISKDNGLPSTILLAQGWIVGMDSSYAVGITALPRYSNKHVCLHCFIDAVKALDDRPRAAP